MASTSEDNKNCRKRKSDEPDWYINMRAEAQKRHEEKMTSLKDLFKTDGSSPEIFRLTMCWNRFYLLMRYLRFDEKDIQTKRAAVDKLAPIR